MTRVLTDPQRAAALVPAVAAAGDIPCGRADRHRAGAADRGEQATDPVAGDRRPVVPQHADRAGIDGRAGRIRFDQTVSEVTGLPVLQPAGEAKLS
jgi:hypothetical protein